MRRLKRVVWACRDPYERSYAGTPLHMYPTKHCQECGRPRCKGPAKYVLADTVSTSKGDDRG